MRPYTYEMRVASPPLNSALSLKGGIGTSQKNGVSYIVERLKSLQTKLLIICVGHHVRSFPEELIHLRRYVLILRVFLIGERFSRFS